METAPHSDPPSRNWDYSMRLAGRTSTTIWEPDSNPVGSAASRESRGLAPKRLRRSRDHLTRLGETVGSQFAFFGLEGHRLALRGSRNTLRLSALLPSAPAHRDYKRTGGLIRKNVALDRMAKESIGTHKILALHFAEEDPLKSLGGDCQTPLDHRTRLCEELGRWRCRD